MRFIVIESRVVLKRSAPVTGRFSMPARSIGSGSWPAARAASVALSGAGATGAGGFGALHGQARGPGRARAVLPTARAGSKAAAKAAARRNGLAWELRRRTRRLLASGQAAPAPVSRRRGQTRSLSVERKSGSGGGWASGVAAAGRRAQPRLELEGQHEHLHDHRQRRRRQLDGFERLRRAGSSAGGTAPAAPRPCLRTARPRPSSRPSPRRSVCSGQT